MIWNILDASSVAEVRERRLRIRYAVVSAVLSAGYLPLHESLLTRLVDEDSVVSTEPGAKEKLLGSFETFGIREKGAAEFKQEFKQVVTVVWTGKETPMDAKTVERVKAQISTDWKNSESKRSTPNEEPKIHFLYHGSSDDLERYVTSKKWHPPEISFMRATIPTPRDDESKTWARREIITDDVLVDALVTELSQRIPALNRAAPAAADPLPRIVVITESDTKYSTAIRDDLDKKLAGKAELGFYSYLRGLDGRSENIATTPESTKPESRDPVDLILHGWGIVEKSSGTSQFDYLRRLALLLASQTKKEQDRDVAVGVLGSDIYDKMLVLQAVRRARPSAIFFTTDLDGLYLEQESQQFTRNLVVASADSLEVNSPNVSKKLPPMRDSYQTVVAKKVLNLLSTPTQNPPSTPTPTPQVFEIALGKSIALNVPDALSGAGHWVLRLLSKWYVNIFIFGLALDAPGALNGAGHWVLQLLSEGYVNALIFGLALGNAFLILASVLTRKPCPDPKHQETTIAPMEPEARAFVYLETGLAFLGAVSLAILCIFWSDWSDKTLLLGEPLALGISIWPSVIIRLLAFVVAIRLLLFASRSLVAKGTGLKVKLRMALRQEGQSPLPPDSAKERVRFYRSLADEMWGRMTKEGRRLYENLILERANPSPEQPFERHLTRLFGSDGPQVWWRDSRLWRLIMWSVVYFVISALLFWYWPPSVPCRGAFALLVEKIVLALGVTLYIVHLVFCVDLHVGAYKFIRTLRSAYKATGSGIDAKSMLEGTSTFTKIIGRTLLYPLTVLILIILSRLPSFDNWVMTPSLTITFTLGALALIIASLSLWLIGSRLKKEVLEKHDAACEKKEAELAKQISEERSRSKDAAAKGSVTPGVEIETLAKELEEVEKAFKKEKAYLDAIDEGVFAAWYNQPIFEAIFSAAAVFGSLSVAGPLVRLFFG